MLTLAINTASLNSALALFKEGKVLQEISWNSQNNEAEKIMPEIDKMLQFNKLEYRDIEKVIVVKGPGSFTGLRVGITVGNTIAYLNNCQLNSIDTFNYFWHSMNENASTALLVFAGSKGVYVSIPEEKVEVVPLEELNEYLNKKNIQKCFGDISESQKEQLKITFTSLPLSFADYLMNVPSDGFTDEKIIKPNYVKDANITIGKNKLFN